MGDSVATIVPAPATLHSEARSKECMGWVNPPAHCPRTAHALPTRCLTVHNLPTPCSHPVHNTPLPCPYLAHTLPTTHPHRAHTMPTLCPTATWQEEGGQAAARRQRRDQDPTKRDHCTPGRLLEQQPLQRTGESLTSILYT